MDTITRRAKTFSAYSVYFDTVTTCWVSSGQILICGFSVTALVGGKKITIVDHQNWALLHKRWHLTEVKKTYPSIVKVPVSLKSVASHWTTLLNVLSRSMPACAVGDTTGILLCAFYVHATKVGSPVPSKC
jgi:hypothetical protein